MMWLLLVGVWIVVIVLLVVGTRRRVQPVERFATGGPVSDPQQLIVGEVGPEVIVLPRGGRVRR